MDYVRVAAIKTVHVKEKKNNVPKTSIDKPINGRM